MKKIFKFMLISTLALIFLVGIGVWFLVQRVDDMAKQAVQTAATYALGVETTLGGMNIGLFSGECRIQELNVANPPGYDADSFLTMQAGEVALTFGSLREQVVELPYLRLNNIVLNLHQKGNGGNYKVIMDNISKGKAKPQPTGDEKGFIIRELVISGTTANVTTTFLGKKTTTLNLPDIKLHDVGSDSDTGAHLEDITDLVVRAILLEISKNGFHILPKEMLAQLFNGLKELGAIGEMDVKAIAQIEQETLKSASKFAKDLLDKQSIPENIAEHVGELGKDVTGGAVGIVKGIGGLFGKKKEDTAKSTE